jgi:hypothetical protein
MLPPLEAFEVQATGRNIVTFPGTTNTPAQETTPAAELIAQRQASSKSNGHNPLEVVPVEAVAPAPSSEQRVPASDHQLRWRSGLASPRS